MSATIKTRPQSNPSQWALPYTGATVLVTGATGFIGHWLCRLLTQYGATVWRISRQPQSTRSLQQGGSHGRWIVGDLTQPGTFEAIYNQCKPAVTFNLAAYGVSQKQRDPGLMHRINTELPGEIATTLADDKRPSAWPGSSLIHAGTAFEYGPIQGLVDEQRIPEPSAEYAHSKLAGTQTVISVAETTGLAAAVARLPTVYGRGEPSPRLLPSLLRAASTQAPVSLTSGEQQRDFIWVGDTVEGLSRIAAATPPATGIINLATGKLHSVRAFVEAAASILGISPERIRFGAIPQRSDELQQGPLSTARLMALTGWTPNTDITAGIIATRDSDS